MSIKNLRMVNRSAYESWMSATMFGERTCTEQVERRGKDYVWCVRVYLNGTLIDMNDFALEEK